MAKGKSVEVFVKKGTKVKVVEVDELKDTDPRMTADRDVHIVGPADLKIAIKKVAATRAATASVVTTCG